LHVYYRGFSHDPNGIIRLVQEDMPKHQDILRELGKLKEEGRKKRLRVR
jgi:hypothetical protein